jgi:hypothetical protein
VTFRLVSLPVTRNTYHFTKPSPTSRAGTTPVPARQPVGLGQHRRSKHIRPEHISNSNNHNSNNNNDNKNENNKERGQQDVGKLSLPENDFGNFSAIDLLGNLRAAN